MFSYLMYYLVMYFNFSKKTFHWLYNVVAARRNATWFRLQSVIQDKSKSLWKLRRIRYCWATLAVKISVTKLLKIPRCYPNYHKTVKIKTNYFLFANILVNNIHHSWWFNTFVYTVFPVILYMRFEHIVSCIAWDTSYVNKAHYISINYYFITNVKKGGPLVRWNSPCT